MRLVGIGGVDGHVETLVGNLPEEGTGGAEVGGEHADGDDEVREHVRGHAEGEWHGQARVRVQGRVEHLLGAPELGGHGRRGAGAVAGDQRARALDVGGRVEQHPGVRELGAVLHAAPVGAEIEPRRGQRSIARNRGGHCGYMKCGGRGMYVVKKKFFFL